jgi:NitT/TauT family transport system substrate-binding protein
MKQKAVLFFLCFFISLFACRPKHDSQHYIRIYVPRSLSSVPILELDGTNIEGKRIKTEIYTDHILAMASFLKGEADILTTGFTHGMLHYSQNKGIVHLATVVWGISSLVSGDRSLCDISNCDGKSILVPFAGSPLELQLKAMLRREKCGKHISIAYAPIQQAVALFIAGKAILVCVPEPFASHLVIRHNAQRVFSFAEKWAEVTGGEARSPQVSLFAARRYANEHSKIMVKLIKKIRETAELIGTHPEWFSGSYSELFNVTEEVFMMGIAHTIFGIPNADEAKGICKTYVGQISDSDVLDDNFFFMY